VKLLIADKIAINRKFGAVHNSAQLVTKLEEKTIELEERLRLTRLFRDVTKALMHGGTLRENLQQCSEAIVQHLDAAFAHVWTHNGREKVLELQASAGTSAQIDGPGRRVPGDQFKIDLMAEERKPHLTNSVIGDPHIPEQEWAQREGLVAFAGYPLIVDDRLVGVLAMFARASLSAATLDEMATIADAVAMGVGRRFAEEELCATHDRLHRLLALSPAVLYNLKIVGRTVIPTFISGNIERLLGRQAAEALSFDWWLNCLHPDDRDRMLTMLASGLKEGGLTAEYRLRHRDGTYRWIIDSNHVVYGAAGEPLEIAGVWTDISEHKQELELKRRLEDKTAEAEAANQAKSMFLSTMSHEIRTPMNAILGYAQLMLRDPDMGADAKKNLEIIGRSGEYLLSLINDVLDMSQIEAGRVEVNATTFNLSRLLEDLAAMFRLRANAKAVRFEMAVDGEAVPYVVADEGKVKQILINLLGNAVKFTQRGYIQLHVTMDRRSGDQLWLSAHVEDSGPGISDEEQSKLFQPFSQTRHGLTSQGGTGLGLAISRKCARLMGGDITLASKPASGSVFRFEIPVGRGSAGVAAKKSAPRRVIAMRAGTNAPRILVVDDQFENRDWLMKLLRCIGFTVSEANSGEAAIRTWEEWDPRLILMDVHMPVVDGLEATRRIKADPRGKETVIMALTASAMDNDRRAASESGADDFLAKPCHEDELLEKIRVLLNIAYDYEETSDAEGQPAAAAEALSAEKLRQLPLELIRELRGAILDGNKSLLDRLIIKVRETEDAVAAQALQELADRYAYDVLTRLLEDACRR
jgi:PAS domain S-box-containing protein